MKRQRLPLAALGACLAILAGTPGSAWGLTPVSQAGRDGPRTVTVSGEEPAGTAPAPVAPAAPETASGPDTTPAAQQDGPAGGSPAQDGSSGPAQSPGSPGRDGGEAPGDGGAPVVPPAVREDLGPAPTPVPDEVVRAPAPPASGADRRGGATTGGVDGTPNGRKLP